MKGKVAATKSTTKAYVSFCLSLSAVVSPALYRFLYRQRNKGNYSTPFPKCFSLFSEKNSLSKIFDLYGIFLSEILLVRFLIRPQLVRKYRTPALSMKYSLYMGTQDI